jgi:hypothetical protein
VLNLLQLQARFSAYSTQFNKAAVRDRLKEMLDNKVMGVLEAIYWSDKRLTAGELNALAVGDLKKALNIDPATITSYGLPVNSGKGGAAPPTQRELKDVEAYWRHKLEAASSLLTKSGVGRDSTNLVADALRDMLDGIVSVEPLNHHPDVVERITQLSHQILRQHLTLTSDQVENSIKPFKYDVDVDPREWGVGQERSAALFEKEIGLVQGRIEEIKGRVGGGRRLQGLINYVKGREKREEERKRQAIVAGKGKGSEVEVEPIDYRYSPAQVLEGMMFTVPPCIASITDPSLRLARNAMLYQDRMTAIKMRLAAIKSRKCKAGPENDSLCPEVYLNAVADKLAYMSTLFINIELLEQFFYQVRPILRSAFAIFAANRSVPTVPQGD